jgi:hypothetical protein
MKLDAKERRAFAWSAVRRIDCVVHELEHAAEDLKWAGDAGRAAEFAKLAMEVGLLVMELEAVLDPKVGG